MSREKQEKFLVTHTHQGGLEPILDWSTSEGSRLNKSWLYPKDIKRFSRALFLRMPTAEEALAQIPADLVGRACLAVYTTAFGLPFVVSETDDGSQYGNELNAYSEIYAERRETPPFGFLPKIIRPARPLGIGEIARTRNTRVPIRWCLDGSTLTRGCYPVDDRITHNLSYTINVPERYLCMDFTSRDGNNLSTVRTVLDGDGLWGISRVEYYSTQRINSGLDVPATIRNLLTNFTEASTTPPELLFIPSK